MNHYLFHVLTMLMVLNGRKPPVQASADLELAGEELARDLTMEREVRARY